MREKRKTIPKNIVESGVSCFYYCFGWVLFVVFIEVLAQSMDNSDVWWL